MVIASIGHVYAKYQWAPISPIFDNIPVRVNSSIPETEIEDGFFYMLVDKQFDIRTKQQYFHYAYKVISESGIQNYSELTLNYNPAYETVELNSLRIYRDGKYIDYKSKISIKDLQREDRLESHIYDEEHTLYIILEKIQINDIIEFSYTKRGTNPIYDNFFSESFRYRMNYKLLDYYIKIRKPATYQLTVKNNLSSVKYEVKKKGDEEEYIWKLDNIERSKEEEENIPYWVNTDESIDVVSSQNWEEIRNWGKKIFSVNRMLDPSIREWCKKIKEENTKPSEKIIKLLRFVQTNIRYLGIEVGENSHKPHTPSEILKQGYGDCKDKTILLITLLNEIGIPNGYPALVSTDYKAHTSDYLPSPFLFNHAIVFLEYENKNYWLDPTITNQRGDLQHNYSEPYGKALILNGNKNTLDTVIVQNESGIEVIEDFDVKDLDSSAFLKVTTIYKGIEADNFRYTLQNNSRNQIQDDYIDFYKKSYSKIDTLQRVTFDDDSVTNVIVSREFYSIKNFWEIVDSSKNKIETNLFGHAIYYKINFYKEAYPDRKHPLYLEYPVEISHKIIAKLPDNWPISNEEFNINNNHFIFNYSKNYNNHTIHISYYYKTLKDHVASDEISRFIKDIKLIKNNTNLNLKTLKLKEKKSELHYGVLLGFYLAILLLVFLYYLLYEKNKTTILPDATDNPEEFYYRIGGWMILPLIGLVISPMLVLSELMLGDYFDKSSWISLFEISILHTILHAIFLLINVFYIVTPVFLLILAYNRKKLFLTYIIYFYAAILVFTLFSFFVTNSFPDIYKKDNISDLIRPIIAISIWMPYFLYSDRCKRTFVR